MIRLLSNCPADRRLMEQLGGREVRDSFPALRIRALWRAYADYLGTGGPGTEFPEFYANETGEIALCKEGNFAVLFCADTAHAGEAEGFLPLIADEVLADLPLSLPGYKASSGGIYAMEQPRGELLRGVTEEIGAAYEILRSVFPDGINEQNRMQWHADLSHRIRHGMSRVFTLDGSCTGTLYFTEEGQLALSQLATLPSARGQGLARRMIGHIAAAVRADGQAFERMILMSQNAASDGFYEHIGFRRIGSYTIYERQNRP